MTQQTGKLGENAIVRYDFKCAGCGAQGTFGVPLETRKPIGCPEGCGATYLQTIQPGENGKGNTYVLTCVVCPVYGI